MSSLRPSDWQAAQHFDERFIRKQSGSFLSQPKQTIWVSRNRTLRTQYLDSGVFLRKQYKILASYKDFCKLQFLFMYSFTHINVVFLFKPLPSKNSSWWRRLEDVLKASFVFVFRRRLEDVLIKANMFALALRLQKTSSRRLQDVLVKTNIFVLAICLQDVFKTSSRRLQDLLPRRLQDVFKTSLRRFEDVFKTPSRRLQNVYKTSWKTSSRHLQVIFKTYHQVNCSC